MRTPEQSHASLQRELATLEEKYTWDDAPAAVKRRMRTIKNRLSAKRSREQAREYVEKLEGSVKVLEDESDSLARRLAIVEAENKILKQVDSRRLSHAAARDQDDAMREASTTPTMIEEEGQDEPAVPPKPSLQLDALLLLFQTVAASQEASQPSGPTPPPAGGAPPDQQRARARVLQRDEPPPPPPPHPQASHQAEDPREHVSRLAEPRVQPRGEGQGAARARDEGPSGHTLAAAAPAVGDAACPTSVGYLGWSGAQEGLLRPSGARPSFETPSSSSSCLSPPRHSDAAQRVPARGDAEGGRASVWG
eukprot:CAMPEP_0173378380 /NCGR_PEP_ID=MMETSP1356-20130122/1542_1 /TAXON_ID=77927 ORGANISM="Hemiselmis virescens, Strain PCC157" /NCGR_SAMPLE_ID=MMETSP1356 /ASSEMBLY_ACC=CAM_ASM_000847 /LENGTH=307 /DNA_ID=CAMNT_0014331423 /DNA_START=169 /DNA_END=1088 /DNA_ORIENTATION=-